MGEQGEVSLAVAVEVTGLGAVPYPAMLVPPVRPEAEPHSTTEPAVPPAITRSLKPSPSRSPLVKVDPKRWLAVAAPGTPLVERLTIFLSAADRPLAEP